MIRARPVTGSQLFTPIQNSHYQLPDLRPSLTISTLDQIAQATSSAVSPSKRSLCEKAHEMDEDFADDNDDNNMTCWVVQKDLLQHNEKKDNKHIIRRLTCNSYKQDNSIVRETYIFHTIADKPSFHIGFRRDKKAIYIPLKAFQEKTANVLDRHVQYKDGDVECSPNRCSLKVGDTSFKPSKHPLRNLVTSALKCCDDAFLNEQFNKRAITRERIHIHSDLTWEVIEGSSSITDTNVAAEKPERRLTRSRSARKSKIIDDEEYIPEEHETNDGDDDDDDDGDDDDEIDEDEPSENSGFDEEQSESITFDNMSDMGDDSNPLKRKHHVEEHQDAPEEEASPPKKTCKPSSSEPTQDDVVDELLEFVEALTDDEEEYHELFRHSLGIRIDRCTSFEQFHTELGDKLVKWSETNSFKNEILPELLFGYMKSNTQEYVNDVWKTVYMKEAKARQENDIKKIVTFAVSKLHSVEGLRNKPHLKCNMKWTQTEHFKKNILPELVYDYMRLNTEEYINHVSQLHQ